MIKTKENKSLPKRKNETQKHWMKMKVYQNQKNEKKRKK